MAIIYHNRYVEDSTNGTHPETSSPVPRTCTRRNDMKSNRIFSLIGALLAVAMLATACGGDDAGSGNDQAVIDAVVANIRAEDDVPEAVDVECMATSMVSSLGGAAGMEENFGLTVETIANETSLDELNLPKDDAISMADGMMDCGLVEIMTAEIAGEGMSAEDASCLVDNMDQDALRDTFAAEFMSDSDAVRAQTFLGGIGGAIRTLFPPRTVHLAQSPSGEPQGPRAAFCRFCDPGGRHHELFWAYGFDPTVRDRQTAGERRNGGFGNAINTRLAVETHVDFGVAKTGASDDLANPVRVLVSELRLDLGA